MAWCLIPEYAEKFLDAIRSGELSPEALMGMTSAERAEAFAKYVGPENAHEVNAQFESKLLLADQKKGLVNWAKKVAGLTEPVRRDILSTISRLDRVLQPEEEDAFLADLAAKKLGVSVTAEEARNIFNLSQKAEQLKAKITAAGGGDYAKGYHSGLQETGTAYGNAVGDLADYINSLKPGGGSFLRSVENVAGLTRQLETGIMHFSAPGVQAFGMVSTKQFWTGIGRMFQYFADPQAYKNLQGYILGHPDYEFAKGGGLGLTQIGEKLSKREEEIQTTLLEGANQFLTDKTGVPNLIKGFSRAFTGYLNYVRFERFVDILNAARMRGEDVRPESEATHDIAQVVNNFTGRAELGYRDSQGHLAVPANVVLYTVRKNVATFQMFNPVEYLKPTMSKSARIAAARQLTGMVLFTGAMTGLAGAMGAKVTWDPRDSDFMKINIGGYKFDLGGANATFIRFLARLTLNSEVSNGKTYTLGATPDGPSRASVVGSYVRGKLAPNAAFLLDALLGKSAIGRPFSVTDEIADRMSPIFIHSLMDYLMSSPQGAMASIPVITAMFVPAALGVGLESPVPPLSENGRDVWGDKLPWAGGTPQSYNNDPVNQELSHIGYTMKFPANEITGVKLTDQQFDQYVLQSGTLAHTRIGELIQSPGWDAVPTGTRLKVIKSIVRASREAAATAIRLQAQGTPNDIIKRASDAKFAAANTAPQ